ncbi:DUF2283 domain-containing protein [Glutamicibacter sp. NPDC087344]|uniref:DUF2283 domain-containing protein n=1 Tax=Glutamicibacter sp. NPDC087344 TaxID=3363994 RepID=UPI003823A416
MTFDAEACAAYIKLSGRSATVEDSYPLEVSLPGITDVILDFDADRHLLGIEILGRLGDGPESILAALSSGRLADALQTEKISCPAALRENPQIKIHNI